MKRQKSVVLAVLVLAAVLAMAGCDTQGAANQAGGRPGAPRMVAQWPVEGSPDGAAVGTDGTVYVNINNNHRVVHYSAAGEYLGEWTYEGELAGLAAGPEGLVYIADWAGSQVLAFQAQP